MVEWEHEKARAKEHELNILGLLKMVSACPSSTTPGKLYRHTPLEQ